MDIFNLSNIAEMAIESKTEDLEPRFRVDPDRQDAFMDLMMKVDEIAADQQPEAFEVEVDDETLTIHVSLEFETMMIPDDIYPFNDLWENSIARCITKGEKAAVRVEFMYPSIWIRR